MGPRGRIVILMACGTAVMLCSQYKVIDDSIAMGVMIMLTLFIRFTFHEIPDSDGAVKQE